MTSLFERVVRYAQIFGQSHAYRSRISKRRFFVERLEDRVTPSGDSFSAPVGTIAAGGSATVRFDATVDEPLTKGIDRVYNQASISGTGFTTFRSDDPAVSGQSDVTTTLVDRAPMVNAVFVKSSDWTTAYLGSLASQGLGISPYGYLLRTGAAQLDPLTWNKLDRVSIHFSENVSVAFDDLSVFGVKMANYPLDPAVFSYDAVTFTATWGFVRPIGADKLRLVLDGSSAGVRAVADGKQLDGEWTDATATFNSGNGVAGGNFSFRFNVGDLRRGAKSDPTNSFAGEPGGSAVVGWVGPTAPVPPSPPGGVAGTVSATLVAQLLTDVDGDGQADPGDRVRYTLTVVNAGSTAVSGVWVDDTLDMRMTLVPGSITTSAPVVATFSNGGPVGEGSSGSVAFTNVSGGSGGYTYSYDFNNDGTFEVANSAQATVQVPASYLPDGPATRVVRGRVRDIGGNFVDYSTTITVNNVPPAVSAGGPYSATPGTPVSFVANVTDPSAADQAAGFTYSWDFGDGSTSTQAAPTRSYAAAGTYTVTLTARDKDGASTTAISTVTVAVGGNSYIVTAFDKIPNFGASPTITAARSGNWSDPGTWSLGRLPAAGDVVSIGTNAVVTYDLVSDVPVKTVAIQSGGSLRFRTDVNTRLTVVNLLVMAGGELQIGTQSNPVPAGVKAEVIFADVPLDLINDPAQYGNGLIALGKVTIHGAPKNTTFVNLAVEPRAGDTILTLSQPVSGWQAGDRLVLPDTVQPTADISPSHWELLTLAAVSADGRALTLSAPLQYSHFGARDGNGVVNFLPDVGNLTRNVVVRSANAAGRRGHVLFTYRADVDVRYAQFSGLGRTTNNALDSTTFDASGNVTHVGTNQAGRYSVHFGNLFGPATTPANGFQFTFDGNSVFCPMQPMNFRWGIDVNNSSYGSVQNNVLYNWAGAGIITQTGAEINNVISHNFVVHVVGEGWRADGGGADIGREGSAFWFGGPANVVNYNVATNMVAPGYGYGFTYFNSGPVRIPNFKGADTSVAGQYTVQDMTQVPLLGFTGNTAYGTRDGLTVWFLGANYTAVAPGVGESLIKDFHVWHVATGIFAYPINHVTIDGFVVRGDYGYIGYMTVSSFGLTISDYLTANTVVKNSDIQGMRVGIAAPSKVGDTRDTGQAPGTFTVQDTYLKNYTDLYAETMNAVTGGGTSLSPRKVILRNVRFDLPNVVDDNNNPKYTIRLNYLTSPSDRPNYNWVQSDLFFVYDYNGVAGDKFQLYWSEQAANFIVPFTSDAGVGAPVTGLTNLQAWSTYGVAVGGGVAPASTTTRAGIKGLVVPLGG